MQNLDQADKNIRLGLDSINQTLELFWRPQDEFNVIHVAGTNGKGSVCAFLELLYMKFKPELRVAKYTSPHLVSVTERIRVNGEEISEEKFKRLYEQVSSVCHSERSEESSGSVNDSALDLSSNTPRDDRLTEFEKITCVAFLYFKEQGVDLAILETGLGGRLDATNVAENKLATVITNIGFDHVDYLGDSLEKIRIEKEGIKREGIPHFEGEAIETESSPNSITGKNFLLAIQVFEKLNSRKLSESERLEILNEFKKQSRARFDLNLDKKILVDGAHNSHAAKELASFIKENIPNEAKTFIIAMMDKDFEAYLEALLPAVDLSRDRFIFTTINSARSLNPQEMARRAEAVIAGAHQTSNTLAEALEKAQGFKVITGSLYLAGEYYSL